MAVLDASAAFELLLKTPRGLRAAARVFSASHTFHAPHLLDIEFMHALRRLNQFGAMDSRTAQQAMDDLKDLRVIRYPHGELLTRIWELRLSLTAYDATYIALAEALDMPLYTCDAKLTRAHGHHANIILLA